MTRYLLILYLTLLVTFDACSYRAEQAIDAATVDATACGHRGERCCETSDGGAAACIGDLQCGAAAPVCEVKP